MTVTHGMDTDAGRRAGADIRQGADQITELAHRLDTVLMSFDWTGTDAERVRDSWREHERPALDATAQGWWQTAVQYQMWHALGLLTIGAALKFLRGK